MVERGLRWTGFVTPEVQDKTRKPTVPAQTPRPVENPGLPVRTPAGPKR